VSPPNIDSEITYAEAFQAFFTVTYVGLRFTDTHVGLRFADTLRFLTFLC